MSFCSLKKIPLLILLCLILCCGCSSDSKPAVPNASCRKFDRFTSDYFDQQLTGNGFQLHFLLKDTSKYPDAVMSFGEYSYEAMKASQKGLISEILSLKRISYASLDVKRKQTYDILMHYFQRKLDFSDLCLCLQDLSPTLGIQAQLPVLLSEYEFHSKKDIEQYFTLLRSLPSYYAGICDFQKKKAKHHCFLHEETCKKIIGQCNHFIDEKTLSENILMTSFQSRINACAFLTQKEQQSYMKTNEKIIRQQIVPAYQTLADTLSSLMTAGYCNEINGLCTMKGGKDYYEYLVHDYTGCSRSVPEIKAQIQSALLTDVKHLQSLLRENSTRLNRLDSTTSASPSDILKDLSQKMTADFSEFQNIPFQLKSVNQTLQNYLSPAFYITPPLDERSKNTIYINPAKTENLYPVLAHEGLPGHMYQNSFFSSTNPPKIRYLLDCGGYSEGWAVYAELLSYSYQFPETAVAEIHRIHSSFSLALYCLCDIGVNYEGWNYSHLKHFLADYNITEDEICNQMFEAVIEDPANYLKYYVGYLQIIELRDYVKNKAGSSFSLKQFHNALLSIGPADFDVVKKWILYEYSNEKKTG